MRGVRILRGMTNTNNMPTSLKQGAEIAAREFARDTAINAVQITIAFGETALTVWFHRDGRVTE